MIRDAGRICQSTAVVGILFAALTTPIPTNAIQAPIDVVIATVGVAALATGQIPPIVVVIACSIAGQVLALG